MKQTIILVAAILAILIALLLLPNAAASERFTINAKEVDNKLTIEKPVATTTIYVEKPSLSPAQIIWLAKLMNCESGIKSSAVNPNDLDNTPSWGILQFKDTTFAHFTVKYGISGELMDAEAQVAIVTHWLLNPGEVKWQNQFPACVTKLGLPPIPPSPAGSQLQSTE